MHNICPALRQDTAIASIVHSPPIFPIKELFSRASTEIMYKRNESGIQQIQRNIWKEISSSGNFALSVHTTCPKSEERRGEERRGEERRGEEREERGEERRGEERRGEERRGEERRGEERRGEEEREERRGEERKEIDDEEGCPWVVPFILVETFENWILGKPKIEKKKQKRKANILWKEEKRERREEEKRREEKREEREREEKRRREREEREKREREERREEREKRREDKEEASVTTTMYKCRPVLK
ncbi:hypothetical protein DUI87_16481 [Hirundo rustica rustica]|uniref:Uncharacterized protein n=1 Tax=Hirundo rustica rustica TaxID=333673 RepID=A0A3M0K232_HIRRU|nr:hypothetical protein DUI87_16481 [Hirundo rustica rustica]